MTGSLSDFFDPEMRKAFAQRHIVVGSVIKCFVKNTNPPKEKRFVVLGITDDGSLIGAVFINSRINWNVIRTQTLAQLQHYVTKEENDFIERDSYIDCSELFELSYQQVFQAIQSNAQNVLGNVKPEDLQMVLSHVKNSPKIKPKLLKRYRLI